MENPLLGNGSSSLACSDCAIKAGAIWNKGHVATFHSGKCGICGDNTLVTVASDWGYTASDK